MKAAVAEVCGLLLCQLHDRNCQRQFCPPAAFLCELATAAPARLQQEVAAAAARMGAAGDGSEEDGEGVEDSAWQQQQQWQQQRQQGLGPLAAVAAAAATDPGDPSGSRGSSGAGGVTDPGAAGEESASAAAAGGGRSPGSRVCVVLEHAPCLVPFELRVQLLQHVLELEKTAAVAFGEVTRMWEDPMETFENLFVTIRWVDQQKTLAVYAYIHACVMAVCIGDSLHALTKVLLTDCTSRDIQHDSQRLSVSG
jgi:hypothetical protein